MFTNVSREHKIRRNVEYTQVRIAYLPGNYSGVRFGRRLGMDIENESRESDVRGRYKGQGRNQNKWIVSNPVEKTSTYNIMHIHERYQRRGGLRSIMIGHAQK